MIEKNAYVDLLVQSEYSHIKVRCYMAARQGEILKAALIVGPEQSCVGVFSNMVTEGAQVLFVDNVKVAKCEFRYRRLVAHLPCKWVAMLILSKDRYCLWQDDDLGLIAGIKRVTETPFLDSWTEHFRHTLTRDGHLSKMTGHNALGSIINCTTEITDGIVHDGIKKGQLVLKG